jgi:23S rRNA (uracil1939-C5)-methyltransferase
VDNHGRREFARPGAAGYTATVPPRTGDILELRIATLAYGGHGIARADDFVVFVRGAVPGDLVRAEVTRRKQRHAEARLLEILEPSPVRVPAPCAHAGECGGCEWQTIAYATQLEFKQRQVAESLEHIGGLRDFELEPIAGMDDPWRYRNKMEFSFGEADGELVLGLHRRGSWRDVVEVSDCRLASARMNDARRAVADACRALGLRAYERAAGRHEAPAGLLRHLVVREGRASGDLALNLYVAARFPEETELAGRVAAACHATSFAVTVNASRADAAVGDTPELLFGPGYLRERLAGVELAVPLTAFLQTNSAMCELLYATALRFAEASPKREAYDLYCGIGSLSLPLARDARRVHAIEIQEEAIAAARENARRNAIANADFTPGDVRRLLKAIVEGPDPFERPAVVLVDPPRAGMARKALQRAAALGAERLVYVSCNPTTLAGNGAELAGLGYRLERVAPVDMFPQTHHVETVALFSRET